MLTIGNLFNLNIFFVRLFFLLGSSKKAFHQYIFVLESIKRLTTNLEDEVHKAIFNFFAFLLKRAIIFLLDSISLLNFVSISCLEK